MSVRVVDGEEARHCVPAELVAPLSDPGAIRSTGRKLLVRQTGAGMRPPKQFLELGGLVSDARFRAASNTMSNALCALLERVFYHEIGGVFTTPAEPSWAVVDRTLGAFAAALRGYGHVYTPMDRHSFVESTYRGRKLQIYRNALRRLDARGLLPRDSYIGAFVKWEKLPVTGKRLVPRIIQPRAPEYNVELGRYLHHIEHQLYRTVDQAFGGEPVVMKGYNAFETGAIFSAAWGRFASPLCLMMDASRFDQHISRPLLRWEHSIYLDAFKGDPYLAYLLKMQLKTKGFVRTTDGYTIEYECHGTRCSGDMNTALGNVLVMCGAVYGLLKPLGLLGKVRVLDNGDDCCLIGESDDIRSVEGRIPSYFGEIGLVMKVEPVVDVLEKISFCQTQPVYDGCTYRMVRFPQTSLTKDAISMESRHWSHLEELFASIGECGLALTFGLPVLQAYYTALGGKVGKTRSLDPTLTETGFFRMAERLEAKHQPVTDAARISFYRAFGIVPDLQVALEEDFRRWSFPSPLELDREEVVRVLLA